MSKNTGRTHFKGKGLKTTNKQTPVSVKLPPELDRIVKSLPNRSEFIREAIAEKIARENLGELDQETV